VEWSRKNGKLHLTIDVPANTSSDVILNKPTEGNWKLDNAKPASKIMEHQEQSEKTILLLGSGKYNFSYNTN
jgi:hypothetical protein